MPRPAFLAAALGGATALGCAADPAAGASVVFPVEALATLQSQSGALTLELRTWPDQPLARGMASVEYRLTWEDGAPADGLVLSVVPWMPEMGHGASIKPSVEAGGSGRYVVSDVQLFMPGKWELRTTLGPSADRATPSFQIP